MKYPQNNLFGFLIGDKDKITGTIPVSHNPLNSVILHIALELIEKMKNKEILIKGIYEVRENQEDSKELAETILKLLKNKLNTQLFYVRVFTTNQREGEQIDRN